MPSARQKTEDQAPAAHSTVDVRIVPCSVTTPDTRPALRSSPRTAQEVSIVAPFAPAARAIAGAALCGSARPSLWVYSAPAQRCEGALTSIASSPGLISLDSMP